MPKTKSLTFYIIHLPIVLGLFLLLALGGGFGYLTKTKLADKNSPSTLVLGDDDEEDDDEDSEDSEDREDEDANDDSDNDSEDDKDDDEQEQENETEDENEVENEVEDDPEQEEQEEETVQTITNADGTKTVIQRKVEGNEIKVTATTYGVFGNIIKEEKFEQDENGQLEAKVKVYTLTGKQASELKLKTEDSKLELKIESEGDGPSHARFDPTSNKILVDIDDDDAEEEDDELELLAGDDHFDVESRGVNVEIKFPISVDPQTGQVFVDTGFGKVELTTLPDEAVNALKEAGVDNVYQLELENDEGELKYIIKGTKKEKLLGLFNVEVPADAVVLVENSSISEIKESFFAKLLDLLSF
ncbi:MAG: hypothetical protein CO141_01185 [Candidatus Moranbacteria bacterium CG_4_9_14_3_um_filter_42_9]|nr:MAG: hypothetical protein CO141_01185 [Candidatus Moranbacteria bacterium CG_4_9_14_3_um_filter_42_9]